MPWPWNCSPDKWLAIGALTHLLFNAGVGLDVAPASPTRCCRLRAA
jgi:hypothetical protein